MSRRVLIIGAQGALVIVLSVGVYMSFLKPEDSGDLQGISTPAGPVGPGGGPHHAQQHPQHGGKPGGGGSKGSGNPAGGGSGPNTGGALAFTDGAGGASGQAGTSTPSGNPSTDQYADTVSVLQGKLGGSEHVPLFGP